MINIFSSVFAADQIVDIGQQVNSDHFFRFDCIGQIVTNVIDVVLILAAIAALVLLVAGGLQWLVSGGDKTKVESAQKMITNAIIGLTIIAASWAVYLIVLEFFGIDLSNLCTNNPVGPVSPTPVIPTASPI